MKSSITTNCRNHKACQSFDLVTCAVLLMLTISIVGCRVQSPSGGLVNPIVLGTTLDQINQQQEQNAEVAKMIVYAHEFEINAPVRPDIEQSGLNHQLTETQIRGIKLTPYGRDHVVQIARKLKDDPYHVPGNPRHQVVVERSESSKLWLTKYHYPVHFNPELDRLRRQLIINVLLSHGIYDAEELVVVGPAFPSGLNANDAANAYSQAYGTSSQGGQGMGRRTSF